MLDSSMAPSVKRGEKERCKAAAHFPTATLREGGRGELSQHVD